MEDIVVVNQGTEKPHFMRGTTSAKPTADGRVNVKMRAVARPENVGTVYSAERAGYYFDRVADAFGETWLNANTPTDRLRKAWQLRDYDPAERIFICRLGRDIDVLRRRENPQQDAYLDRMVSRIKRSKGEDNGLLYELHIAGIFDDTQGVVGEIADDGEKGYDVKVSLPNGHRLWVSCKRLYASKHSKQFDQAATLLSKAMAPIAHDHGIHTFTGLVQVDGVLQEFEAPTLTTWADLCRAHSDPSAWSTRHEGRYHVSLGPDPFTAIGHIVPDTLRSRHVLYVASDIHSKEITRVNDRMKSAVGSLKGVVPSAPSSSDALLVALDVPRDVSASAVAAILRKEFANGNYGTVSGVLLTRTLTAAANGVQRMHTVAEELYLLINPYAGVPLHDVVGGDSLAVRVAGEWMPSPPMLTLRPPAGNVEQPEGYLYWTFVASYEASDHRGVSFGNVMRHEVPLVADVMLERVATPLDGERRVALPMVETV